MSNLYPWLTSIIGALLLVSAWHYPGTSLSAALCWSSIALLFTTLNHKGKTLLPIYFAGVVSYLGGFSWLLNTIRDFGGIPTLPALAIFLLFASASAVQFAIWGFCFKNLPDWCSRYGLKTAVSWLIAHHFWIKIFPWDFGHTQIAFEPFAQLAGILGVTGITFIMMWVSEALCARRALSALALPLALLTLAASVVYGVAIKEEILALRPNSITTVMVQGNLTLHRADGITYTSVNRDSYLRSSARYAERDTLIIWPESSITDLNPDLARHVTETKSLPFFRDGSIFLVGGITGNDRSQLFNSSILIRADGSLDTPYHKMILMPFGEYTPFSRWLPWLKEINHTAGDFVSGSSVGVLSYKLSDGRNVKLSPLICYEDIVPGLAREASAKGAEILINQTNDVWFGDTVAPYQHHIIASFRAIENRRFLLRSTNTGVTAVVDPLGRTLAQLLPYTEAVLPMEISLIDYKSFFTQVPIPTIWLVLASLGAGVVVFRALARRR